MRVARFAGFANIHPLQDEKTVQGAMELMYDLQEHLIEITGMDWLLYNQQIWCTRRMDRFNVNSCIP